VPRVTLTARKYQAESSQGDVPARAGITWQVEPLEGFAPGEIVLERGTLPRQPLELFRTHHDYSVLATMDTLRALCKCMKMRKGGNNGQAASDRGKMNDDENAIAVLEIPSAAVPASGDGRPEAGSATKPGSNKRPKDKDRTVAAREALDNPGPLAGYVAFRRMTCA
jgi:hypothetical protein